MSVHYGLEKKSKVVNLCGQKSNRHEKFIFLWPDAPVKRDSVDCPECTEVFRERFGEGVPERPIIIDE